MSAEQNVQTVKDFLAAISRGDHQGVMALVAEDIEWIIPGEDWPLAGRPRTNLSRTNGCLTSPSGTVN